MLEIYGTGHQFSMTFDTRQSVTNLGHCPPLHKQNCEAALIYDRPQVLACLFRIGILPRSLN